MNSPDIQLSRMEPSPKLGLVGPGAADWLAGQGLDVPELLFDVRRTEERGRTARIGTTEFVVEAGPNGTLVSMLGSQLGDAPSGVHPTQREDVTLLLGGRDVLDIFAQTCAIDLFREPLYRIVFTRVAGVTCGILPDKALSDTVYRLWVDPSYADYLWDTLVLIAEQLGGQVANLREA